MRRQRVIPVLWVTALLAICCSATAALAAIDSPAPSLVGTWSGKYSGAYNGTFTLSWTQSQSKLTGSIALSSPHGTYGITGRVRGSAIQFGAVGAGATYAGSVSGTSMSGTYRSPRGGGSWSAHKISSRTRRAGG